MVPNLIILFKPDYPLNQKFCWVREGISMYIVYFEHLAIHSLHLKICFEPLKIHCHCWRVWGSKLLLH